MSYEQGTYFRLSPKGQDAAKDVRTHIANGGRLYEYDDLPKYAYYLAEAVRKKFVFEPFLIGTAARDLQGFVSLDAPTVYLDRLAAEGYLEPVERGTRNTQDKFAALMSQLPQTTAELLEKLPNSPSGPDGSKRDAAAAQAKPAPASKSPVTMWERENRARVRQGKALRRDRRFRPLRRVVGLLVLAVLLTLCVQAGYYVFHGLNLHDTARAIEYDWAYYAHHPSSLVAGNGPSSSK